MQAASARKAAAADGLRVRRREPRPTGGCSTRLGAIPMPDARSVWQDLEVAGEISLYKPRSATKINTDDRMLRLAFFPVA